MRALRGLAIAAAISFTVLVLAGAGHVPPATPSPSNTSPVLFGEGVFSTPADEFGAALSPNGAFAFFNRSIPRSQLYTIFRADQTGAGWSPPRVARFSGRWRDFDPVFGPSGRAFFISDRPRPGSADDGEYNAWYLEHPASEDAEPRDVGAPVNGAGSVHFVSETSSGALYVCATREKGSGPSSVYRVARAGSGYAAPEDIGSGVNSAAWLNLEAYVSKDESVLIVSAYGHDDTLGDSDLYVSRRCGGTWGPLVHLPAPFNSPAREYSPRITPDGRTLLYASERGLPTEPRPTGRTYAELVRRIRGVENGLGNIYAVPLEAALAGVARCGAEQTPR
jgi:WD40-like Beta Propeller Repeat